MGRANARPMPCPPDIHTAVILKVLAALRRLDAPRDAFAFYEEHAVADPRHGKDWVDHVVAPLAADPEWARRIVRGARWRSLVNRRFFDAMAERFVPRREVSLAS